MNREHALTKLQMCVYLLNLTAVCFVAGIMTFSLWNIVDAMEARTFLDTIQVRPWKPEAISVMAVSGCLALVVLSGVSQLYDQKNRGIRLALLAAEIACCITATVAMNMNYNGLVLLVVADMIRGQKGSRQKLILGIAVICLYTVVDYNLMGHYFGMITWDSFLTGFRMSTQAVLRGVRSIFLSLNLVLFILNMTMLIQDEYRERERIQSLNDQLESANERLKAYAVEAEKLAETRERNRLAREIHDTLGHVLTGIVAGLDACITMIDMSPDATKRQLEKIRDVARQGITDVRRSVSRLRPDALEKLTLEDAIIKMLEDLHAAAGTEIRFDNQVHPLRFHEDEEEVVYRVVQEASTNSIRHGHASRIHIAISKKDQWLTITVQDNGSGCGQVESGFGLKHMQERLGLLNGTLEYDGSDGFLIVARIPIRWGEEFV